ncbi:MAG: Asp-tRNA(Asn)/Glu-tRNA(Gln) amidotransferase GatCAB subunit B, partial [Eggerthellaceae bacterium]|nr:Asp-tRNA(Asn)/Glu-tRNA(Gln) amidotransferase GatCAB subunit B [Eggerthellaceae bacterium]
KARRLSETFGLSAYDARHLVEQTSFADFFEEAIAGADNALAKPLANLIINDIGAYANSHEDFDIAESPLTPNRAQQLCALVAADDISSKQAKEVFAAVITEDKDPREIVEARGMRQVSDTGAIEAVVDAVLAQFPDKVEQYHGGKTGLLGFFVGQCMKEMKGQGNPKIISLLLEEKLH